MAINCASQQHNGGFLPDIILLTLYDYRWESVYTVHGVLVQTVDGPNQTFQQTSPGW